MKYLRFLPCLLFLAFAPLPAQQAFLDGFEKLTSVLDPEKKQTLSCTIELVKGDGVPKMLENGKLEIAVAAPDRLRIATKLDGKDIVIGRDGQELWAWREEKNFGVVGAPGIPRFRSNPDSVDTTQIGPLTPPIDRGLLEIVPRFFLAEEIGETEFEGEKCRILEASPQPQAIELLQIPPVHITMHLRKKDNLPVFFHVRAPEGSEFIVKLHGLKVGEPIAPETFRIPAPKDANVERVAVSHLMRFMEGGVSMINIKYPRLGPATGTRTLVATHGKGRLEMHDGTLVLFLKGTPEEMGEQHGTLLGQQVRDLVTRVLYGVGVGSSFEKGEWFFGTIERCQERIAPHVDPRYTREMDAMARAAGCAPEEMRLANFFPELFHCSGFALLGDATVGKRIYHGRILDYMKGIGLEPNAVVIVHQPDQGHAWANISYAGFVGSVTAMNERHISIGEMGGRGEGNWDGKPMAQLVREVMEKASTLDEAVEIMRNSPRTCEYYYVIADGKSGTAVGIKATPQIFEVVKPGETHPQLDDAVKDTVLLSAGDRYKELVKRVKAGFGTFDDAKARDLMTRPVCMDSNIHSVLFAPDNLDFWVANADGRNVASHTRYTKYNLRELLESQPASQAATR